MIQEAMVAQKAGKQGEREGRRKGGETSDMVNGAEKGKGHMEALHSLS